MVRLKVSLLGKFSVLRNDEELVGLHSGKVKELFCYLLLNRDREHSREVLAAQLWGECTTALSKKYLRQTLWQLHHGLGDTERDGTAWLQADLECVRLDTALALDLDVDVFEKAFRKAQGVTADSLEQETAGALHEAVALYRGELLEGWYQDWCLYHRERLQNKYLGMLDSLMAYCELHGQFATGLELGERLLKEDRARERTYVRLLRMDYLAGDRAGALRRFQRCEAALQKELNVGPAKSTLELYEQIRADRLQVSVRAAQPSAKAASQEHLELPPLVARLQKIRSLLVRIQRRVQVDIQAVDSALSIREDRH